MKAQEEPCASSDCPESQRRRYYSSASRIGAILSSFRSIALLYDLIRPKQQRRRDREAEELGGLEIKDQLELRGLLHGELSGLRTFQNPSDIDACLAVSLGKICAVANQTARIDVRTQRIHRGHRTVGGPVPQVVPAD